MIKPPTKKKKRRRLKPGLWFGQRKVEVEAVKKAHKAVCCVCRRKPSSVVRVLVKDGSGRHQTTRVFCDMHGVDFLKAMQDEAGRAVQYIVDRSFDGVKVTKGNGRIESIRPPVNGSGDMGMEFLKEQARERAARKKSRDAKA